MDLLIGENPAWKKIRQYEIDTWIVNELKIQWPDGSEEVFEKVKVNQYLNVTKGKGYL